MNYELAKELRDAGFVQGGAGKRVAPPDKIVVRRDDFAYVPTLEELIEECMGDSGFALHEVMLEANPYQWAARTDHIDWQTGATPTEAVTRLWLALNSQRYAGHEAHSGKD